MAQTINVDVTPSLFQPTLYYHQGDIGREFAINISTKDGYEIPSGATVKIEATKPSGLGFSVSGTLSGNVVSFVSTEGMTDEFGRFPAQLEITSGNTVIYTANFLMVGEKNAHPASTTDGSQEEIVSEITLLVQRAESAAATAGADAAAAAQAQVDEMMNYLPTQVTDLKNEINNHRFIHQYNFLQHEYISGFYNSNGQIVSHATRKSYIVPIKTHDRFFYSNVNTSIAVLDANKDFIALPPKSSVSSSYSGSSLTINAYAFDLSGFNNAVYVAYPYGGGVAYLRSATTNKFIPTMPVDADSSCEDVEIIIDGDKISYPNSFGNLGAFKENTAINLNTGVYQSWDGRNCTGLIALKKGTKIITEGSNVVFVLNGFTSDGLVIINGVQKLTLESDFVGILYYYFVNWKRYGFAPRGMTPIAESIFIRVVTPQENATNQWYGKTWYSYGTSLSDIGINDEAGNNGYSGKYPLYIDSVSGMIRHNGAIGSGGIRTGAGHGGNVLNALLQTPYDVDLVTLETLPNDGYATDAYLGDITDSGTTTICGAFKTACEYITKNTRARMVVIFVNGDVSGTDPMNADHQKYINAKNKLKTIAEMYGVSVIDAEKDAINWNHRKVGVTYVDHIHLNYLGGEIIGRYIWNKLKDIQPYPLFGTAN